MKLINGIESHCISVDDRGLQYGDGLFETIALHNGKPLLWNEHFLRLQKGCRQLGIRCPKEELLHQDIEYLLATIDITEWLVLKIIVTRGEGSRGYMPPINNNSTRILYTSQWPDRQIINAKNGISTIKCRTMLSYQPALAGLKHLNRLEQIIARSEWHSADIKEGIVCDMDGRIIEGTMSNIFLMFSGTLYTPAITSCGIKGVQRENIMNTARNLHIKISIIDIDYAFIYKADEIFITNSIIGIWPVIQLDSEKYPIGETTRILQEQIPQCTGIF